MLFEILSAICLIFSIVLFKVFFVEKKKNIDNFNEAQKNFDSKINSIYDAMSKNQSDTNNLILNHTSETYKKLQEIATNASIYRKELEKIMLDDFESTKNQISLQSSIIEKIIKDYEQLRKKIEFFTEIGSDSKQLNEIEDFNLQENILEKALSEIENNSASNKSGNTDEQNKKAELLTEIDENSKINEVIEDDSILDSDQRYAYSEMENTHNNHFITGKAGTGKSFLLRLFEKGTKKKTLKVSPTGISALNIGGATIHSIFGFNNLVNLDVDDITSDNIRLKSENKLILQQVDTIIIDEISMVRADVFDKIDRMLKAINNNDKLFGGKQIIVFGDLFQLPPIVKADERKYLIEKYGGIFFFFSNAYKEGRFNFIELETNHRQKQDTKFFELLNRMREGIVTDEDISLINQRVPDNDEYLRRVVSLYPKRESAERVNKTELDKIPSREYTYEARIIFNKYSNQNINIDNNFPITSTLKLKLGALVMMVNNDVNKQWVNGTLGIVSFINNDIIKVKINDIEHEIHKNVFESREAIYNDGRINYQVILQIEQYPIILAYAITIHKSQGMTYQKIACDITNCFAPGQAYVALSRCSSLSGLYLLQAITRSKIDVDSDVKNFYINTKELLS